MLVNVRLLCYKQYLCKIVATQSLCQTTFREFKVANETENYKLSFKNGSYTGDAGYYLCLFNKWY